MIPDLSGEVLGWISQAQTQCLRVCNIPPLAAPVGISQGTCPVWKILVPVLVWLLLTLPFRIAQDVLRGGFGPSVPFASLQWELFQEQSVKGHTLFLFPLGPLWDQLPFHSCFIGLLKGCQLDIGKWGFSLLQSAGNKHHCGAI